ncbi:methionine--tRNA ligase [Candidatus Dependentiae bacterium]
MNKKIDEKKFYVTTPIYYVTAKPHLGSLYSTVLADVVSRWNKLQGKKTFFLTGTDEHGQKVAAAAEKAGKQPKEFVDGFIDAYKNTFKDYETEYDHFIRTTDPYHEKAVQGWLKMMLDKGEIYKDFYKGWYCPQCELFVKEREEDEPKGPKCPDCERETVVVSEECYFFKLSKYQDKLLKFYKENPDFVVPKERLKEVINFVKSGLKDLSISRTKISWGIPFPGDEKHVTYVWADALNNYITAIGYGQSTKKEDFDFWWPADLHIMAKDILRFHAIYWPAFLMASGLPLPKRMLVHGWITVDKKKMSKSFGNVVDPNVLKDLYGVEPVRYYLVRQMAINQDGDFSIEDLEQRIASDLANDLGNLLNRMVTLAYKNDAKVLKAPEIWPESVLELRDLSLNMISDFQSYMSDYQFHMALACLWKFINKVNAFFHAQEPWKLAKKDRDAFLTVLSATAHSLRVIAVLLWPIMPKKMEALLGSLGMSFKLDKNWLEDISLGNWNKTFTLNKIDTLFKKPALDEKQEGKMVEEKTLRQAQDDREQDYIKIDDFAKVHLVVGQILEAEDVQDSNKLIKLQVDCGSYGKRQVFAGVKKFYSPEDLIGKQGVFVVNLKPRKMMGMESQGMMLFAEGDDKKLQMVTISAPVPNGTRLR